MYLRAIWTEIYEFEVGLRFDKVAKKDQKQRINLGLIPLRSWQNDC